MSTSTTNEREERNMVFSDKVYSVLKWICIIAVPALITLISTLGTIYHQDMTTVTATIGAITTFIGALIGISNYNYSTQEKK